MKPNVALAGAAAVAVLLAAACSPGGTANNEAANASYADDGSNAADSVDDNQASAADAVDVVAVPAPATGTSTAAAAPLVAAASAAQLIAEGTGIERVPYDGGWAWRENGRTIRTSSRDGRRVSYFHPGDDAPYLVQDADRAYAYSGGRVQRSYTNGRDVQVDKAGRDAGDQLARRSEQDRTQAERVAATQPDRIERVRPSRGSDARGADSGTNGNGARRGPPDSSRGNRRAPTARPSPTPTSTPGSGRDRRGDRHPGATPTPQPTPDRRER